MVEEPVQPLVKYLPTEYGAIMISNELLELLRCPHCVREKNGLLTLHRESWLICNECGRKYPIVDDIPIMLLDEGEKWIATPIEQLPVPPLET